MNSTSQTLYDFLNVSPDADHTEIERACLQLGERFRPGKNSNDVIAARTFAILEEAFATLTDPHKRDAYDKSIGIFSVVACRQSPKTRIASPRWPWATLSVVLLTGALAYVFVYLPNIEAKEQEARVLGGRAKAAEEAAKEAAESAKAALEKAKAADARAQEAEHRAFEQRAGEINQQQNAAAQRAQQQNEIARRDAQDFAALAILRNRCESLTRQVQKMTQSRPRTSAEAEAALYTMPIVIQAIHAKQQACDEFNRKLAERQIYEATFYNAQQRR